MGRTDGQWKAVKELQYGERACMVESVSISGDTCFMLVAHAMQGMAYWMSNVVTLKIARSREKSPDAPARLRQESDSFAHLAASLLSAPPEVKFRKDGTAPFVVWDTMAFPAMEYVVLVRSLATKRVIRFPAEGPPFRLPPRALFRDGPCVVAVEYGASRVRTAWSPAVNLAPPHRPHAPRSPTTSPMPRAPSKFVVRREGGDVILSWEPLQGGGKVNYFVEIETELDSCMVPVGEKTWWICSIKQLVQQFTSGEQQPETLRFAVVAANEAGHGPRSSWSESRTFSEFRRLALREE
jgi:hypothetical protein